MTSENMKKFAAEVESNEELKAKLRACKTQSEIEAVARENNFECDDQVVKLDLDDLDGVAGGKASPQYRPFNGYGSQDLYDRMMQLNNHTFRR